MNFYFMHVNVLQFIVSNTLVITLILKDYSDGQTDT
jgi:hypothetical protein